MFVVEYKWMNETNEKLSVGTSVMTAPKAKAEEIDQV